jgi:hypothetical protein
MCSARAYSKTEKRANPTTTAAPAFENEIPTGALLGFEFVAAGPVVVVLEPVTLPVDDDFVVVFVFVGTEVVVESPKSGPWNTVAVVTAAPALLTVIVWPSPSHVEATFPTGTVVAVVPLSSAAVQSEASPLESSKKRSAASLLERLSRMQMRQYRPSSVEVMLQ